MKTATRERLAAATGIVTALLFVVSFVVGISPEPPDMDAGAGEVAKFVTANKDALRVEILLNTLAMLSFLWFLGSVRAGLRSAEGGAGRVSAIASGGGLVGTAFVIAANVFAATATLRPETTDPGITRVLVDLSSMSLGLGAAAFGVFFIAVAIATLMDGGLPSVLGWLALVAGVAALVGVVTIFTTDRRVRGRRRLRLLGALRRVRDLGCRGERRADACGREDQAPQQLGERAAASGRGPRTTRTGGHLAARLRSWTRKRPAGAEPQSAVAS